MANRPPSDHERLRLIERSLEMQRQINEKQQAHIENLLEQMKILLQQNSRKTEGLQRSRSLLLGLVVAIALLVLRVDARLNLYGQEIDLRTGMSDESRHWVVENLDEVVPLVAVLLGLVPSLKAWKDKHEDD